MRSFQCTHRAISHYTDLLSEKLGVRVASISAKKSKLITCKNLWYNPKYQDSVDSVVRVGQAVLNHTSTQTTVTRDKLREIFEEVADLCNLVCRDGLHVVSFTF